jgi:hypothetical protein
MSSLRNGRHRRHGHSALAPIGASELNDSKGYVKNLAHPETFSEIFDALESKSAFTKPQMVEDV